MKALFIIFPVLLLMQYSLAQSKNDYVWLFGRSPNDEANHEGGSRVDFNFDPPLVSFFELPYNFDFQEISMISDSSGQLQCYTDGCSIINFENSQIINGDSLNPGYMYNSDCGAGIGYPTSQGSMMLPFPGSNNIYYLFHIAVDDDLWLRYFYYTVIDMNKNGGLGEVVLKNQLIYSTFHFGEQLTAIRHANGRDWWLVIPYSIAFTTTPSNKYFKFLFSPEGISGPFEQEIGDGWGFEYYSGQATFSPDGTKYARMNPFNGLRIFDFDRCSGGFSNPVNIYFPNDTIASGGVAFSTNSRYLYVSGGVKVYQFDTWAADIEASRKTVAIYDGFMSPFSTLFYQQMLAPDGKIYITVPSSSYVLHVIHAPNQPGDACQFEQHGLTLPTLHDWSIPNFPHFRLYDMPGSPCDTLGIDGPVAAGEAAPVSGLVQVYPNPVTDHLNIIFPGKVDGILKLATVTGAIVRSKKLVEATTAEMNISGLPAGVYFLVLPLPGGQTETLKVIVSEKN